MVKNMAKKIILALLITCVLTQVIHAQNTYYWYRGVKQELRINNKKKFVLLAKTTDTVSIKKLLISRGLYVKSNIRETQVVAIPFKNKKRETKYWTIIEDINQALFLDKNIEYVSPFFYTKENDLVGLSHLFYVKLKSMQDTSKLQNMATKNNVQIIGNNSYMPLWFTLSCSRQSKGNALQMANLFYESNLFAASEPDIMVSDISNCVNDTYFQFQWGLDNRGQNNGIKYVDIKLCKARQITTGSNDIVVAVFDHGVELNHPDLTNIYDKSFDTETGTSPSKVLGEHGTACAGIIGATTNNRIGIAGIAPKSPIMSISNVLQLSSDTRRKLADGINFAVNNGASVISNSWGSNSLVSQFIDDAIDNALTNGRSGKGCIIVFASGNNSFSSVEYPSSLPGVISVGAVDRCGIRSGRIDIVPQSCDPWKPSSKPGSSYGSALSVVAPGTNIYTTDIQGNSGYSPTDYYTEFGGTSAAAPHVAGVAALILSVNPNLTWREVKDIIEKTAQKIRPDLYKYSYYHHNGKWNKEMGYGLVDAYTAVQMAKALSSPADLYIRDTISDVGNTNSGVLRAWASPDIWIEDMDGNKVDPSEDKDYNICVRIHNKSDYPSSINDTLILNWTKAGVDLWWNRSWLGQEPLRCGESDIILGGFYYIKSGYIGNMEGIVVPDIPPHSSKVFKVKWHFPKPGYYSECFKDEQLWHYCLLARVHDGNPIWKEDESNMSVSEFVKNNENVAWRNITFLQGKLNKSTVSVGNPFKEPRTFSLSYSLRYNELGELLNKYADVYLNMSSNLFELWQKSDFAGKGFKVVDKNKILLTEPTATIERLVLQPEELYLLEAEVNFFTQEKPESNEFMFDIAEYVYDEKGGKELIGGETYIAIRNPERDSYFKAKAVDDKTVLPAEPVSFRAEPISEDAVYTWFDQKGDTVAHGLNLTVTPTSTQHYKLEVVATADGFKDCDSVCATVRNGAIVSLSPNPTDNQLTITYRLAAGITNATIEVSDVQNLSVQSYPVTSAATTKTVSLAGLTAGTYMVKLIVDGVTVDTRQVIKN